MSRRMIILSILLAILVCVAAVWAYGFMTSERAGALSAGADLRECLKMSAEIERIRRQPALAAEREQIAAETTGAIERAAKAAGIDPKQIIRITPGTPQRVGDTVYKEKPTHVLLKDVTLQQLVMLLHGVATSPQSLQTRSVRIAAPRKEDTGGVWTAEIIVSYLIYEPLRPETLRNF